MRSCSTFVAITSLVLLLLSPAWAEVPLINVCETKTETVTSPGLDIPIPDPGQAIASIEVSGLGPFLWDTDLVTQISHSFTDDLDIFLISPQGTFLVISSDNGGPSDNLFLGTRWDDQARNPITDIPPETFQDNQTLEAVTPEEPLAKFKGENPNGTWTIIVEDDGVGDTGIFEGFALELTTCQDIPYIANPVLYQNNEIISIKDSGDRLITSTVTVSDLRGELCDVELETQVQHPQSGDLEIRLRSPSGTSITLTTDNGEAMANVFSGTSWLDEAGNPVNDYPFVWGELASPLAPEESFAAFWGEDPNGEWTLFVTDDLEGDTGALEGWTLLLRNCFQAQEKLYSDARDLQAGMKRLRRLSRKLSRKKRQRMKDLRDSMELMLAESSILYSEVQFSQQFETAGLDINYFLLQVVPTVNDALQLRHRKFRQNKRQALKLLNQYLELFPG